MITRALTLTDLPPAPAGRRGWPWTEAPAPLPERMPDGAPWPRVSIVTPSYNQGPFLEETIRSVLLQGYPNLELLLIDGGSTDESVAIIRKYAEFFSYWVCERDEGQSDALNRGFARCTGSILTWLNSDDTFQPSALGAAVRFLAAYPEVGIVYGDYTEIDEQSHLLGAYGAPDFSAHAQVVRQLIPQPAAFFRQSVWQRVGPLDVSYHYVMDRDLWTRAALYFPISHIPVPIANVRLHGACKTVAFAVRFALELERFYDTFFALPDVPPDLRALEPEARGANCFFMGREYLGLKQPQEARAAFARALQTYPLRPNKLMILAFWIDTYLHSGLAQALFRAASRLKDGAKALRRRRARGRREE